MKNFKYGLEPYRGMKTRHTCPSCGRKKSFARYIDFENGTYVGDDVGRCNREQKCGYHKKPDNKYETYIPIEPIQQRPTDYMPSSYLSDDRNCNLNNFLSQLYDKILVNLVFSRYKVSVDNTRYKGATLYPQIDINHRIRTIKGILYDDNGHRIKYPYSVIYWKHREYKEDFELKQCLFGEHLLSTVDKFRDTVVLVESEKTALIGALEKPSVVWLATGGLSNLSNSKLEVLRDFNVLAYPDKGAYDYWLNKLAFMSNIRVSKKLEQERMLSDGEDIADLIIKKRINGR